MNDIRPCVLANPRHPHQAAPGWNVCATCADTLHTTLADLQATYEQLDTIEELTPTGSGDNNGGGRAVPGPRSPAVDALLNHTDPRSQHGNTAALATIVDWARLIRAEHSIDTPRSRMLATVPHGRITMGREIATIRLHWGWLMGTELVPAFAVDVRGVLTALRLVRRMDAPTIRIGSCPTVLLAIPLPDGGWLDLACAAPLRVKTDADTIRCRNCGASWSRGTWHQLGDGLTDYAKLSDELGVNPSTLRYWSAKDHWTVHGTAGRRLVLRAEAHESYRKRRGHLPLEQAG